VGQKITSLQFLLASFTRFDYDSSFYRASSYASAVLAVAIQSVRLSVRPSVTRVLCDKIKQRTACILIPHERTISVVFWHQQWLVGDAPSVWSLRSKWPTLLKNADYDRFPHVTSQS